MAYSPSSHPPLSSSSLSALRTLSPSPPPPGPSAAPSPSSQTGLYSPALPSKKRLRPHSRSGARELSDSAHSDSTSPHSGGEEAASYHAASILASQQQSPPPDSGEDDHVAPLSEGHAAAAFASSKRRASSENSLSSLEQKEPQGSLQTLLADSSEDDEDEDDDDHASDDDEEEDEEEEKSPPHPVAAPLTPLSSMASAAAASALSPLLASHPSPVPPPHSAHSALADSPSEFSAQLFVIYMPKSNFKRFVISSLNTTIIRASKGEKQPVPRMNFPSLHTARPVIPPLASPSAAGSAAGGSMASSGKPPPSDSEFTYNVSMEDVLSCLDAHGVRFNPAFMWMDLSDFGARFVQQMMGDSTPAAIKDRADEAKAAKNDQYGGLWYNVVHKSHLVVNHFAHPFLGEGYAVVITLDLLDSNKDQAQVSPAALEQSMTQTITVANDTLYKATKNINEGGITAHPALLSTTSNTAPTLAPLTPLSPFAASPRGAVAAAAAAAAGEAPSTSARRKVRPVESIGEMLDRIGEYQRIRLQVKSKNKACEKLGYSKGTINAYREKVKQALQLGIDLNMVRKTKYRDFKRVLAAAHQQREQQHTGGGSSGGGGVGGGGAGREKASRKDDPLKRRSNSFGDLGIALMARQDAKNGRKKGKSERARDEERSSSKRSSDDDDERQQGNDHEDDRQRGSPDSRYRSHRHGGKSRETSPPLTVAAMSSPSVPPGHGAHHMQPMASMLPQSNFSPQMPRSTLTPQVTYIQAAPHPTYTTTSLPPGTTYVLPAPIGNPQQLTATTFAPQYSAFGGNYGTVFASTGTPGVYAAASPAQSVRTQGGTTYQVVSNGGHPVQMANVQQQPTQATFTSNVRYL